MRARVHTEHISGEKSISEWMEESAADDHADDLDGQGVYRDIRIELEGEH